MSFCLNFPLFLVVASLISSVVSSLVKEKTARGLFLALTAISVAANLAILCTAAAAGENFEYLMGHYPHPWGNELKIGILEALFSAGFSTVLFLTVFGGRDPLNERVPEKKRPYYYTMCCLIQAALLVLVYTNDIFTGYVFIEICTLSSCGILMIRENGKTILASVRYMIFSLIGSGLFLFGVVFLYNITGHLLMPELKMSVKALWLTGTYRTPLLMSMCLIGLGIAVKSGLFPFHLWMADTYGAAIPTSSGILSGVISKGYIFFLIKIIFDVFGTDVFYYSGIQHVFLVLGCAGVIFGSIGAISENNIFRMTAYSSAAQIGYIYMGIGISADLGIMAALYQILAHAFAKPALFLAASRISAVSGNRKKFHSLQGAGYLAPAAGAVFTFGAFSMIGLPPTMGFITKYLFGTAAFGSDTFRMVLILAVLVVSTVLNVLYFARTILRLYTKPEGCVEEFGSGFRELPVSEFTGKPAVAGGWRFCTACGMFVLANASMCVFAKPLCDLIRTGLSLF